MELMNTEDKDFVLKYYPEATSQYHDGGYRIIYPEPKENMPFEIIKTYRRKWYQLSFKQ